MRTRRIDSATTARQTGRIRVIVADDSARMRRAICDVLTLVEDVEVVGVACDGEEAVALARESSVDVVLMDVRMPIMDGFLATNLITTADPEVKVVMLTALPGQEHAARTAGAVGHMLKEAPAEEVVRFVRLVAGGALGDECADVSYPEVTSRHGAEPTAPPGCDR
jgi:DNA-binding NarL/FixJ family response regulator